MDFEYNKEEDERILKNLDLKRKVAIEKVSSATKFVTFMRYLEIIWIVSIIAIYFFQPEYLIELLFCGVILSFLVQSLSTAHLEALTDLRSIEIDRNLCSVIANANKYIDNSFERINELERKTSIDK